MRVGIMNFRIPLVVASEEGTAQTIFYKWCCKGLTSGALHCVIYYIVKYLPRENI